ncbi:MAG: hypothetical protein H0V22_08380 [Solirubrobacterales bacterium]|nr:hypothetical protein [Solirubrobacterales bacterium]
MPDTALNRQHRLAYIARGPEWAFALPSGDLPALDDVVCRCSTFWNGANSLFLEVDEDNAVSPAGTLLTTRPIDTVWLHPRLSEPARAGVMKQFGSRARLLDDRYDLGEPHALSTEPDTAARRSMLVPMTSDPDLLRVRRVLWGDVSESDLPDWRKRFDVAEVGGDSFWAALLDGQIAAQPISPLTQTLFGMQRVAQSGPLDWPYLYVLPDRPGFQELVRFWNFRSRMPGFRS